MSNKSASATPRYGGTLRLHTPEPRYLNPILEARLEKANMLIFEGLIGFDHELKPIPRLAEKWDVSADGKTITFQLNKDAKWHDGTPFTSADVAFTFEATRETKEPTVWKSYMLPVDKLETPDKHTVVVKYRDPYAPALLTWAMAIVPKHVYSDGELTQSPGNRNPIGTGPYKFVKWEPGERILLEANDKWWHRRAYIDNIELLLFDASFSSMDALEEGKVDFMQIGDVDKWVTRAQAPDFRDRFEMSDLLEPRLRFIAWNCQKPPFDNKLVRQALLLTMNRRRTIEEILHGNGKMLYGPFYPNMFGADPSVSDWPWDRERGERMLNELNVPYDSKGERFDAEVVGLLSEQGPVVEGGTMVFGGTFRKHGVMSSMTYFTEEVVFKRIAEGDFEGVYFTWRPDIPDPDPYSLLHSSMIGAGSNVARYSNPEVDRLLDTARATLDQEERKKLYHKLHAILNDEVPYMPLNVPFSHYAWDRRLRGVHPHHLSAPQARFPGVANWWFAEDK